MYKWNGHKISDNKNVDRIKDLLQTNKDALKSLIHTSAGNSGFRKTQTVYKKFNEGSNNIKIKLP